MRCNQGETWLEFIFGHSLNKTFFVLSLDSFWTKTVALFGQNFRFVLGGSSRSSFGQNFRVV
jgi:hypothetical protein